MDRFRLWFVENENVNAVLFCDTLGVYKLNEKEKAFITDMNMGRTVLQSAESERIEKIFAREEAAIKEISLKNCDVNPFYTLIMNVSNTCNMKCKYCFANHGLYDSERGIMDIATAIEAVDTCIESYGYIGEIKFFGGEPLMALNVMKAVCEHVSGLYDAKKLKRLPEYRVITNGTIMNDEIAQWIKDYNIQYVVSLDGNRQIQDEARVMTSGKGSFDLIMENLEYLKKNYNTVPSGIEVTYNGTHEKNDASLLSVIKFLHETTGVKIENINLSPVMVDKENDCAIESLNYILVDYLDDIFEEIRNGGENYSDKKFRGLVRIIKNRMCSGNQICEAGTGCIAVSASGDIYPCLMFTDQKEFLMGHVGENVRKCSDKFKKNLPELKRLRQEPCISCPINKICRQCMGINRFQTGEIDIPYDVQCELNRKRTEKAVLGIAEELF